MIYIKAALSSLQEASALSRNMRRKEPGNIFLLSLLHLYSLQSSVDCTGGHRAIPALGHTWSCWSSCTFLLFLVWLTILLHPGWSGWPPDVPPGAISGFPWSCSSGVQISLDGIICEQGTLQGLRGLTELFKRLFWKPWNPQEFFWFMFAWELFWVCKFGSGS